MNLLGGIADQIHFDNTTKGFWEDYNIARIVISKPEVYSELEVKFFLHSETELEKHLSEKYELVESKKQVVADAVEIELPLETVTITGINEEAWLIDKYLTVIITRHDLLKLPIEERAEIKRVFNSEFRFFNLLQNRKAETDNNLVPFPEHPPLYNWHSYFSMR